MGLESSRQVASRQRVCRLLLRACRPVFINNKKWQSVVMLFMSFGLLMLQLRWLPHYSHVVNKVRSASYALVFFCAISFVILAFGLGLKDPGDPQVSQAACDEAPVRAPLWAYSEC